MKWKINFLIPHTNYNLAGYAAKEFIKSFPKKRGKQLFKEWCIEHDNGTSVGIIPEKVLKDMVTWLIEKIVQNPSWADNLHRKTEKYNWDYYFFAKKITNKNLKILSNEQLADIYIKLKNFQLKSHTTAISTTWFIDSEEDFSEYLKNKLFSELEKKGYKEKIKMLEFFILLTTPAKMSLSQKEGIEFLCLAKKVGKNIKNNFKLITNHWKKWKWIPYGYIGPAYDINHYVKRLDEFSRIKKIDFLIEEEKNRNKKIKKEHNKILKEIKISKKLEHLFSIARDIIWLKDFRKYTIWHGHYVLDIVNKEIAKRLNLSLKQVSYFVGNEAKKALKKGKIDEEILNQRAKYSIIHATEKSQVILTRDKAKFFKSKLSIVKEKSSNLNEITGTVLFLV